MSDEVLFTVQSNGAAAIILNRPKALNSLSRNMIRLIGEKLEEWKTDEGIAVVIIKGAGSKGLCAGGDIKTIYEAHASSTALQDAERFFEEEYKVDMAIYQFPKPIIACLDGIVMGGGVGLTYGASHRIVTERTKWSMPEMNIGFFPDVGAGYFLNKAPGYLGRYLALTASVIQAADVLHINGADYYMESDQLGRFIEKVEGTNWHDGEANEKIKQLIDDFQAKPAQGSELAARQDVIDQTFKYETLEEIYQSLGREGSDFSLKTREVLLTKSPFSLKIALKQLIDSQRKTMQECFATDLLLAKNFLNHNDFYEGVRSVLIDRDHSPKYEFRHLSDVTDEIVTRFFSDSRCVQS